MAELRLPPLGPDTTEGTLLRWLRRPGDRVSRGDVIAQVETRDGLRQIASDRSGQIEACLMEPGFVAAVGAPIATIRDGPAAEPGPSRAEATSLVDVPVDSSLWERFFSVAPLVLVGTKEPDGRFDLAPKHMAMPLGWDRYYCFVCSPRHRTYQNIRRHPAFTVSFPRPSAVLMASLAAAPRCDAGDKPSLLAVPTIPAHHVEGVLVEGASVALECTLHQILDGYGANSLIVGLVVAASVRDDALRDADRDEADQIFQAPLLAYLPPGRFAEIRESTAFPFHKGFVR